MSVLTPDQEKALIDLVQEIQVTSPEVIDPIFKRITPGRTTPGYYSVLADPWKKKGGKRKNKIMKGGAVCDNQYISLAIDSIFILAGTAVAVGTTYTGYSILDFYMRSFHFDDATLQIMGSLYREIVNLGNNIIPKIAKGIASGFYSAYNLGSAGVSTAASAVRLGTTVASSSIKPAALIAVGRYIRTQEDARADANLVIESLQGQLDRIIARTGAITRSAQARITDLQTQITDTRNTAAQNYNDALDTIERTRNKGVVNYAEIKRKVCELLDRANQGIEIVPQDIKIVFQEEEEEEEEGEGRGGSRYRISKRKGRKQSYKQSKNKKHKLGKRKGTRKFR
jgi:hypothetical protein